MCVGHADENGGADCEAIWAQARVGPRNHEVKRDTFKGNKCRLIGYSAQCLNGRAPPYLSEHCVPVSNADTQRHLLAVPRFWLDTDGRRTFSDAGLELSPGFYSGPHEQHRLF